MRILTRSSLIASVFLPYALWPSFLGVGKSRKADSRKESWDVCRAVTVKSSKGILLRGTASPTPDGLLLGDYTCPVAESRTRRTPAMILVEKATFVSDSERKLFEESKRIGPRPLFQLLVRGDLTCQPDFKFQESDDGDIVAGNGFGSNGLAKCKLENGLVLILREIE